MKNEKTFDKKMKKYARIAKIVGMAAAAAVSVYRMIPKNETFDGVDGNVLIETNSAPR